LLYNNIMIPQFKIWHMIQCKFLPSLKFCKGSALFLIPIELQIGRVINIDISPMDTKDDLNPFILKSVQVAPRKAQDHALGLTE